MPLTLVILAAGLGSRFGRPKQIEAFGPHGELLLEYAIFDARRAGFERVVLVIRQAMREAFESALGARYRGSLPVQLVSQDPADLPNRLALPADRTKPWGTAHAVLVTASVVDAPFAVANADDFYGATAYQAMAEFLRRPQEGPAPTYALVGFPLGETLSDSGAVNRARCETDSLGWLQRIQEVVGIRRSGSDGEYRTPGGVVETIAGDVLVSMNLWGFTPEIFAQAETEFRDFFARNGRNPGAELPLPNMVMSLIRQGRARVRLLGGAGRWCGVTNPEDKPQVSAVLRGLMERGEYPRNLWG